MKVVGLACVIAMLSAFQGCWAKTTVIHLYGRSFTLEIGDEGTLQYKYHQNDKGLKDFYTACKAGNSDLVQSISGIKNTLLLDDWLILKMIDVLHHDGIVKNPDFVKWFVLGEMGYNVHMLFQQKKSRLLIISDQNLFNVFKIGKYYCFACDPDSPHQLDGSLSKFNPYARNAARFGFGLEATRLFDSLTTNNVKHKQFKIDGSTAVPARFSENVLTLLDDFPNYNMLVTFGVPLSHGMDSLVHVIKDAVSALPDSARVNYVMKFVSMNASYAPDEDVLGVEDKWLAPEQFLFYGKGDCEDISSFLFYMLRQVLDKPMIVISYPTLPHINIGIALDLRSEPDLVYKGNKYYICEASVKDSFIPIGKYKWNKLLKYKVYESPAGK